MQQKKFLNLLSEKYPTKQSVCREIINLNAILNLPKGTEHFMSDLHGEYEAFYHIVNNCSGVIREKVENLFSHTLSVKERQELCTLIYYPREKLEMLKKVEKLSDGWYRRILNQLIQIAKLLSSKYTRSKVRKAMPVEFAYIIDELLHVQMDEDDNQELYHKKIIDTILDIDNMDEFIIALSDLIKRLAVDHLHIVGDIYDRGACADRIMNLLMTYHSVDIEWGNHDILWMGAAAGSEACIANVIRNNLRYHNTEILENSYGISLRELTLFAEKKYSDTDPMEAALSAISVIMFKLEGQIIKEHPEYEMEDRLLLDKIDKYKGTVLIGKERYKLNTTDFPTILLDDPYELSVEEKRIMDELKIAFINSACLQKHIAFLYEKGSMYRVFNGNLLYHGCIPMDEQGDFQKVVINGKSYQSKEYLDCADKMVRKAPIGNKNELDFMWYLWCGYHSPLSGRKIKTFERTYINNHTVWIEEINAYYNLYESENFCKMILEEFGLHSALSHIINGHTPVKTCLGEQPIRAGGKLLVIDGGFCRSYHKMTGIAGYTLIFNSHGIRIKAHKPFESVYKALGENKDIESVSQIVEIEENRVMVKDTDIGKRILEDISDLQMLLLSYRSGEIVEKG